MKTPFALVGEDVRVTAQGLTARRKSSSRSGAVALAAQRRAADSSFLPAGLSDEERKGCVFVRRWPVAAGCVFGRGWPVAAGLAEGARRGAALGQ